MISIFMVVRRVTRALSLPIVVAALVLCGPAAGADPLLSFPLRIGDHSIRAEIANTPETRGKGLMFRNQLAASSGMIFVFPEAQHISMWMKNTVIPLSVAFIDANGRILNIEHMQPRSEQTHSSSGKAKYALETNQGWFTERRIQKGHRISGLDKLPPAK